MTTNAFLWLADWQSRPKALHCACAYTDLDARTGEREFFNNLAYNMVDLECTIYIADGLKGMSERSELIPCII